MKDMTNEITKLIKATQDRVPMLPVTSREAAFRIDGEYNALGPYFFAKERGLLEDNSAENFAIAWMTYANLHGIGRY
jgi:hypothetical protein